ncbi:MAG: site-specific DNA-methyltransferase [Gammaproteobacteria bacterium]
MTPHARPEPQTVLVDGRIEFRLISTLQPDPKNTRVHSKAQIRQIAESIRIFGFLVPVLIDKNGRIIAGHGRVLAAQFLGQKEVPVICVDHLTPAQVRAFAIADNRLTENARWDEKLLAVQLKELSELNLDFSIEVTGFSMAEIDLRIESLNAPPEEDPADLMPAPGLAVSKVGDGWLMGKHRAVCGNSLEERVYEALMGKKRAGVVFTDPPYNVPIDGHVGGKGKVKHREFAMAAGEMSVSEFVEFLRSVLKLLVRFSLDGSIHYVCMDWRHTHELTAAAKDAYTELKNICVWTKPTAGMGSLYRSQHEFVLVFKNGKASHRNNIELGRHGRNRSNVWPYAGVTPFGREVEEGNLLAMHPTVKPVRMIADALLDCSARGDIVLDPFLGSGSTLIAAERVGRICYGIELDPRYVDTAIRRWQKYTGLKAKHAVTGKTFDDVEAEKELAHVG